MGKKSEMEGHDKPGDQSVSSSSHNSTGSGGEPIVFVAREQKKYDTKKDVVRKRQKIEVLRHMSGKQAQSFSVAAAYRYRYPILFSWAVDG